MTEHLIPNHEAMTTITPIVEAFSKENNLPGKQFEVIERVKNAESMLGKISEQSGGEPLDKVVAEFVDHVVTSPDTAPNEKKDAEALAVEGVRQQPTESPRTASELGNLPLDELGDALRDLGEVKGEEAVETVVEAIEASEGQVEEQESSTTEKSNDALWKTINELTENHPVYTNKNARVSRIPLSLPMRNQETYSDQAVQYAKGNELEELLANYGVDSETIAAAKNANWNVPVAALPKEIISTINTANLYEAVTRSHDERLKHAASERNSRISLEDVWDNKTLHHVTNSKNLRSILSDGQLGYTVDQGVVRNMGGEQSGNINFGNVVKETPPDATNEERMNALSYNDRGDVYIHYARPAGCYREGEEYVDTNDITLMSGGMPSTEISALMIRNPNDIDSLENTWKAVTEAGFYIPIFDADGNNIFTREDFDKGIAPAAVVEKQQWEKRKLKQAEARERLEAEAATHRLNAKDHQAREDEHQPTDVFI